jgi:glutathione synthase/RimK-type ligase-like ATP-grasp enzyme
MPRSADIALLTDGRFTAAEAAADDWYFRNILHDDSLLQAALSALGLTSVRLDWADPTVDWTQFRCAVFRTTWDYFERYAEFTAWLERVARETRLVNAAHTIWWNLDKHYLADLEARGVPVVPSCYLEPGDGSSLVTLLRAMEWPEAVLKPCVSGAARHTYRVNAANAASLQRELTQLLAAESFMLQPFVADITVNGEYTLMVLDGEVTHAVQKVPKAGDFRVQDDHGGTWTPYTASAEQMAFAQRAMQSVTPLPQYGRVDMVRGNDGAWQIMELELIEPELWLRTKPEAATRLAQAIARDLHLS